MRKFIGGFIAALGTLFVGKEIYRRGYDNAIKETEAKKFAANMNKDNNKKESN